MHIIDISNIYCQTLTVKRGVVKFFYFLTGSYHKCYQYCPEIEHILNYRLDLGLNETGSILD